MPGEAELQLIKALRLVRMAKANLKADNKQFAVGIASIAERALVILVGDPDTGETGLV